jgi:glutathione peroxidase
MANFFDFSMKTLRGKEQPLKEFEGKVTLVVNVASACGYTPQYKGLEKIHEELSSRGLVVAGFPSNDYGAQEPGSDTEIDQFCTTQYGVKFPMFSKIAVKGASKHPLYEWLTTSSTPAGEVRWNFEKFLINKKGQIVGRYASSVAPESKELRADIEKALAE